MRLKNICALSAMLISDCLGAEALDVMGVSPFAELKHSHISKGYGESTGGNFFGTSFLVRSSVAEAAVGQSSDNQSIFILNTGLIKPNRDLIFINGLDLIFLNNIHLGELHE